MRGIGALLVLLALPAGQESREERGRYRLSVFGREAGREEFRLERFDSGKTVLFSTVRFEVEIAGKKSGFVVDAALTMDGAFAPKLYAGYHKAGLDEKVVKIEWKDGKAVADGGRTAATTAPFVLDVNTVSQLIPILRRRDPAKKKLRVFRPQGMAEADFAIEDRGEATLTGAGRELKARELKLSVGYLDVLVHVDADGRLLRAHHAQTELLAELEGFEGLRPVSPLPEGVVEEEVSIPAGDVALAGTFSRPKGNGPWPAALILSGSGPQDRDGVVLRGKESERFAWEGPDVPLYREIARALAGAGMAVLRYDDRGCGKSGGDFATATFARLAADAEAAAGVLRAKSGASVPALLGHGEGGLIASQLAATLGAEPLVLLGAPARPLDALLLEHAEDVLRAQGAKEELLPRMLEKEKKGFDRIKAAEGDWLDIDERRTFVGWMKERFRADPVVALKAA
jgi:hypothetical protein